MRLLLTCILIAGSIGCADRSGRLATFDAHAVNAGSAAALEAAAAFGGFFRDPVAERRMQTLCRRVLGPDADRGTALECRLLNSSLVNAVSVPDGYLYVTRGLYRRLTTDAQLAAVLAHEIAHLEAEDHYAPRAATLADALDKEIRADARAAELLVSGGFERQAIAEAIQATQGVQPDAWIRARVRHLAP